MVQDIIVRLSKSQIQNEPTLENTSLETEPVSNGSTQRRPETEESVHPMDTASDSATYHLIPLFKPDQAEVRLFCIHPAGRYTMNLTPVSNGFTQQVRESLLPKQLKHFFYFVFLKLMWFLTLCHHLCKNTVHSPLNQVFP